jgi:predicted DNA-binding transcriptional regulator YafY
LRISHFSRQNGKTTEREVSPQRLVHYRDNWYLDAWCHLRDDVRSFSIDAITQIKVLDTPVREVPDADINAAVDAGYGIFGGAPKGWATLKFTPERARWVAGEHWHPHQRGSTQADGSYVLEIPYSDERELMGDLLRFGADVEVMAPPDLRSRIKRALHEAVGRYV